MTSLFRASSLFILQVALVISALAQTDVIVDFDIPDTVCINQSVTIANKTTGASSHYWNFCTANLMQAPTGTNLGNLGGQFSMPVFMDYVFSNGNYYGFLTNYNPGKLVRLNFGNSLLNTPTVTNLGNFGDVMPIMVEGIQVVQNEGKWYAIIVAGYTGHGLSPRVIKIEFGSDIENPTPVATNWGDLGNMEQPIDLHVFQENGNWYGFTANAENNTITRFDFTNSFDNTPTAVNLGNIGNLAYPTGIYAVNDNNFWRVFVVNGGNNSRTGGTWSLTRLDFGNSLLNTPTGVNLGNPGSRLKHPRDLTIIKTCGQTIGFAVNGATGASDIVRIDFGKDLTSVPQMTSIGNIGNLNFPHSIARLFRVGADLYSFITNVGNNTITRLRFSGCNNSSIPNSNLESPSPVKYSSPGTYYINLTVDDGLPTQASICKPVVVVPEPVHKPTQNIVSCTGTVRIGSSIKAGSFQWSTGETSDSITVGSSGIYWVETNNYGCINRDSFSVTINPPFKVDLGTDKTICQGSEVVLDAGPADTYLWSNGSTSQTITVSTAGTYYVKAIKNTCESADTVKVAFVNSFNVDFSYEQDLCDPFTIKFNSIGNIPPNVYWDFGDGTTMVGNNNPSHHYESEGNYRVKFAVWSGSCADTVAKTISIKIFASNLLLTSDSAICPGSSVNLKTTPVLSFCWSPSTYLDNPNSASPVSTPPHDMIYYFTAETIGDNLIVNGNFTQGNSGFTSGYRFASRNTTEGEYFVGTDPASWNSSMHTCQDHTTGSGNMMLVNGSPVANVVVWSQTINVKPNTNYAFSTWIQALWPPNPAELQFSINGKVTGIMITASLPTCTWSQFYTTWNSGENTTAVISIVNKNTRIQGNDFALDDISFAEVFVMRDSVTISVDRPNIEAGLNKMICSGGSVQLEASGASAYFWSPAVGLSSTSVANPLASPTATTDYVVTGTSISGCSASDTITVGVFPVAQVAMTDDTIICKNITVPLSVSGGVTYSWTPSLGLSDPSIPNPLASPTETTRYYVSITDANMCVYVDSVDITVRPNTQFTINPPLSVCAGDSVQLGASGGEIYAWAPTSGLSQTNIENPFVSPQTTTDYSVTITDSICRESQTLTTRVTVLAIPQLVLTKSNDIDCRHDSATLNATGADQYLWNPALTLNEDDLANPVAIPTETTRYFVTGKNNNGCQAIDSIDVVVFPKPDIIVSEHASVCKNSSVQLFATGGINYSWTPAFLMDNPNKENPVAFINSDTKFFVTITDSIGCEYLDSVNITLKPEPQFAVSDVNACKGDTAQFVASGGQIYSWSPSVGISDPNIANPMVLSDVDKQYTVTITETTCNYSTILVANLKVLPGPTITTTKSNDLDCFLGKSQLLATGAVNYQWSPSITLDRSDQHNPIAFPKETTMYTVMGVDADGCKAYDSVLVKVEKLRESNYLVPNAFSPNNDGLNDCFKIKYWGVTERFELSIYNRWGERVFYTKDPDKCWDGTYKGMPQNGDVYVYVIKADTFCQPEVFRKGTLVLIR